MEALLQPQCGCPPFTQVRWCRSAAASGEEGGSEVAWARGWARQGEEEASLLGSASCLCKMKSAVSLSTLPEQLVLGFSGAKGRCQVEDILGLLHRPQGN